MLIPIDSLFLLISPSSSLLTLSLSFSLFLHPAPFLPFFRPLCRRVRPRILYPRDEFYRRFRELSRSNANAENRARSTRCQKVEHHEDIDVHILVIRIVRFFKAFLILLTINIHLHVGYLIRNLILDEKQNIFFHISEKISTS